ncbi:HepT-like ribonuclease domain-containing protein [Mariniflexile sp.]|uniref:HepT-like ribonuclease domain-containing protein n=1 Tax=Mariniflexile sp. TaxID=1979402 RepID=UPI004047D992
MQREILKYLLDVQESINSIYDYLGSKQDFGVYKSNKLLRRGIERELEIIGEAINRILKFDDTIDISNSRRIVDLRNWVIHGYDKVDNVIIWG